MVRRWTSTDIRLRLALVAIVIAIILPLAWYLGSPLLVDRTVDEGFPSGVAVDTIRSAELRDFTIADLGGFNPGPVTRL